MVGPINELEERITLLRVSMLVHAAVCLYFYTWEELDGLLWVFLYLVFHMLFRYIYV